MDVSVVAGPVTSGSGAVEPALPEAGDLECAEQKMTAMQRGQKSPSQQSARAPKNRRAGQRDVDGHMGAI